MRSRTHYKCHIYEDITGFRWKLVTKNGRIVAESPSGFSYKTPQGAHTAWWQLTYSLGTSIYVDVVHD